MFFLVFVTVHNFFYPHFQIRFRHPQVSSPRFADTSFASRFFELFSLPASLRLNTQRGGAPSMCAFKEEERSVLISVTLMKGITGYKTVPTLVSRSGCKWRVQPCDSDLKERFLSFVCLFIYYYYYYYYYFAIRISRFFPLTFFVIRVFFSSAFFYPHFPIRIRHPQVSGPRFADTRTHLALL